jgi:RNA recognition motif-containing protein
MSTSIYVGNLPLSATEKAIRDLFSAYGAVESVKLITDRSLAKPQGDHHAEPSEYNCPPYGCAVLP